MALLRARTASRWRRIRIAETHDAWILCDEVYRGIGTVMPSVSDRYAKGIATGSLSKALAWRRPEKAPRHKEQPGFLHQLQREFLVIHALRQPQKRHG